MTEETQEPETPHPVKTVNSILEKMCAVLREADQLANHEDLSEKTSVLRDTLKDLPPSELNEFITHINAMYMAMESMKINRIAFRADVESKRLVAIVGIGFGVQEIELYAPFDRDGYTNMLKEFSGSLEFLNKTSIIMLGGNG